MIFIPLIIQSYILHWFDMYVLYIGLDRIDAMIRQHFYWYRIKQCPYSSKKCDTFRCTNQSNKIW